jgi:membrane-bound lytic murein transglycosylase D
MLKIKIQNTIIVLALSVLSGCKSTSSSTFLDFGNNNQQKNQSPVEKATLPESVAKPDDIVDALTIAALELEEGAIDLENTVPVFDDVWDRVRYQLSFEVPQNRQVVQERNWYTKHPHYFKRVGKRAQPFLHFIVEEIEKREMPIEIALLPIVESAFDPFAYSHGRASGLWQFVPGTGNRFKLKQTWWYDGRRDVVAATRAALDYLSFLHKTLDGDWLNAIAAYNSGEGRVLRAIKRNRKRHLPTDFWSLDLPKETTAYVPKLLALADLLKRSEEFKIAWYPIANEPAITVVDAHQQIDLAKAAELANMKLNELHRLNPAYNQWATDPNGPHKFVVPIAKAKDFKAEIARLDDSDRMSFNRYVVKSGDTLGGIAQKHNVSVKILRDLNKLKGNIIRVNQALLVPTSSKAIKNYELTADNRLAKKQSKKRGKSKLEYTVKSGDTLWDIGMEHDVNVRKLASWNGMAPTDPLRPGKKLVIWTEPEEVVNSAPSGVVRTVTYKVKNGDSLARIANRFNVTVSDIAKWNRLDLKKYLQPGQALKLIVNVTNG